MVFTLLLVLCFGLVMGTTSSWMQISGSFSCWYAFAHLLHTNGVKRFPRGFYAVLVFRLAFVLWLHQQLKLGIIHYMRMPSNIIDTRMIKQGRNQSYSWGIG